MFLSSFSSSLFSFESTVQISKLQDLVNRSKMARCRGRFVCPVILYNGKVTILLLQSNGQIFIEKFAALYIWTTGCFLLLASCFMFMLLQQTAMLSL